MLVGFVAFSLLAWKGDTGFPRDDVPKWEEVLTIAGT